eukprot:5975475-Pyramimonas_sp.AAC.1
MPMAKLGSGHRMVDIIQKLSDSVVPQSALESFPFPTPDAFQCKKGPVQAMSAKGQIKSYMVTSLILVLIAVSILQALRGHNNINRHRGRPEKATLKQINGNGYLGKITQSTVIGALIGLIGKYESRAQQVSIARSPQPTKDIIRLHKRPRTSRGVRTSQQSHNDSKVLGSVASLAFLGSSLFSFQRSPRRAAHRVARQSPPSDGRDDDPSCR